MTTTVRPEVKEPAMREVLKPNLIGYDEMVRSHAFRTLDVDVPGRGMLRVRELRQRERDFVDDGVVTPELGEDGKILVRRNEQGYRARAIASASINADGSAIFPDVAKGAELINDTWTSRQVDAAFKAVDELNLLTRGTADAAGKDSGKTATAAG
jgi:hypothetical protein